MVNAYVSSMENCIIQEKYSAAQCQLFTTTQHKKNLTLSNSLKLENLEKDTRYAKKDLLERVHRDWES